MSLNNTSYENYEKMYGVSTAGTYIVQRRAPGDQHHLNAECVGEMHRNSHAQPSHQKGRKRCFCCAYFRFAKMVNLIFKKSNQNREKHKNRKRRLQMKSGWQLVIKTV